MSEDVFENTILEGDAVWCDARCQRGEVIEVFDGDWGVVKWSCGTLEHVDLNSLEKF